MMLDRRNFLRNAAAAGAVGFAGGANRRTAAQTLVRKFAPVKVARQRVIRSVVGLRPYRDEGYVVRGEKVGNKLLIHHYGHGGAGITLSWGTAVEAVELARAFQWPPVRGRAVQRKFAVIGCGVIGLTTALMLQRKFQDGPGTVTIYSKDLPPDTTSNIAGGFWSPTSVYDPDYATSQFVDSYRKSCRVAHRAFQLMVGKDYGVRWIDTFNLFRTEPGPDSGLPGGDELYPLNVLHRDPATYFGFPVVRQYSTMLIEPHLYLAKLLRDFYSAGGKLIVKEFKTREEVMRLPEPVIFNCTGLGARALFNDEKMIPVRGQLEILLPQPEVDYCYLGPGYMFPRSDGIVLGGTFEPNQWSLEPSREKTNGLLNSHAAIAKGIREV